MASAKYTLVFCIDNSVSICNQQDWIKTGIVMMKCPESDIILIMAPKIKSVAVNLAEHEDRHDTGGPGDTLLFWA